MSAADPMSAAVSMSAAAPPSAVDAQAQALLQQVMDDRDRRCASLRAAAESQAKQILRAARAQARSNVHRAVSQERSRMDLALRQAAARADIEARRRQQEKSRELLGQMWAAIAPLVESRWSKPELRRSWIEAVMREAGALIAGRAWLIEASSEWTDQERGELTDRARRCGAAAVEYSRQAVPAAGLRIRAGNVCVDATVAGLLARRDAIEAAFLAEYLPERPTHG